MTKWQSLTAAVTLGAIALGTVTAFNQPSYAQGTTFFCDVSRDGVPTTFANTRRGTVAVIKWTSEAFSYSGYTPERRCQEVSSRFQRLHNSGQLNFLTAGYLNGQPAICAGNSNPPCTSDKLLFTLKPGSDAAQRIQQIFNISVGASNSPLLESRDGSNSSVTVDMNRFLEGAPIVQSSDSAPNPALNTQPGMVPPTRPQPNVGPSNDGGGSGPW
jgi:hypothetical protein